MDHMKQNAIESIDSMADYYKNISDYIWEHPELSLKENKSAEYYCERLAEMGFTVEKNLCGISTAFSGSYGSGRPVIGILGEFDALSGLSQKAEALQRDEIVSGGNGHGCGHNLLGAGSFAAACAVKSFLEQTGCPGTVIFFGCPGEEGGSSKAFMARDGVWKNLDAALTWHPSDVNQVYTGTNNSCIQVLYRFKGVAAHAAGEPHNGRSALDAVELMNVGVQFLREHMKPDCRIHYAITETGGISPNVVQANASVLYMVRSIKVADAVKLQARVDKIARGAALMTETELERTFIDGTANLVTNYTLEDLLYRNFREIGPAEFDEEDRKLAKALRDTYPPMEDLPGIGAKQSHEIAAAVETLLEEKDRPILDFLMPQYSGDAFSPGSTDVGDVSWLTPTAQFEAAAWPAGVPGHSWQIVACGKSPMAKKGMLCAAKVLAASAIDLLEQPELLDKAREEFKVKSRSGYVCPIEEGAVPTVI